jgi:hypothetical protein
MDCPKCAAPLAATVEGERRAAIACTACGFSSSLPLKGPEPAGLRPVDWVLCGFIALGALGLAVEAASLSAFERMFRDFGGELPFLTSLVLRAWLPAVLLGLVASLATAGTVLRSKSIKGGRALLVAALLIACTGGPGVLVALYLPIFRLAGSIR